MKFKRLFFTLLYSGVCSTFALTCKADTNSICDLLREEMSVFENPQADPVDILFFDINHDGIPDALLSYRVDKSAGGCHGNSWELYRFENGEWQFCPFKMIDEHTFDPSGAVWARGDDFYSLTEEGQKPKLFLVYVSYAKNSLSKDTEVTQQGYEITIDGEGYLKTILVPELSTNYFPRYDEENDTCCLETTEMQDRLVPLSVESFSPSAKKEGTGAPPDNGRAQENTGATASRPLANEAQRPGAAAAHAATPKRNPWLYLAVLPVILAGLYLMRKKR